jgi:hypothetical protein
MKASALLKQNIDALLKARGQTQHDLAVWCRRSDGWLSKILADEPDIKKARGLPLKYLDRIADFFGLATYQLFQPGIGPLTERRSRVSRRSGRDRRISAGVAPVTVSGPTLSADEAGLVARARQLKYGEWQHVSHWIDAALLSRGIAPDTTLPGARALAAPPKRKPRQRKSDRKRDAAAD